MAHQLRLLAALVEDRCSNPSIPIGSVIKFCNFSSREPGAQFWPQQAPGMYTAHTHMYM